MNYLWKFSAICLGLEYIAALSPIYLRQSPLGYRVDAEIGGQPSQEYYMEFSWDVLDVVDIVTHEPQTVRLSPDLVFGPTHVIRMQREKALESRIHRGTIGIGFRSAFAESIKNFVLVPDLDDKGLILYPSIENPSDLCGEFTYTDFDPEAIPAMRMSVLAHCSLIPNPITGRDIGRDIRAVFRPHSFHLRLSDSADVLPREIYDAIVGEIQTLGNISDRPSSRSNLGNFDCLGFIDLLPSIEFSTVNIPILFADENFVPTKIVLEPRDYIEVDAESGSCKLVVRAGYGFVYSVKFGRTLFKKFAVHIDYNNMRIGFCDMRAYNYFGLK